MTTEPPKRIEPLGGPLHAVVADLPGSKSIANRALVCAALADGTSRLERVPAGDDTVAMLRCVELLGAGVVEPVAGAGQVAITGSAGRLAAGPAHLDAQLAGTTSRFVTALAALGPGPYTVDGGPPLRRRPMAPLHDALAALGARIEPVGAAGHLPVRVSGGDLRGGTIVLPGDVSSQFVTALMLIAPYLAGPLTISLSTPLVSRPYVEITGRVMAGFGVDGVEVGERSIHVPLGRYRATDLAIEPDASSASYLFAAAAICGGEVTVEGLGADSMQGDAAFVDVLARMGCTVERSDRWTTLRSTGRLVGIEVDMADISDTVPSLAVVAPFASTPTRITGVGFIRAKESDRIGDVVGELRRCGIIAHEEADGLVVEPSSPLGATVATHDDHRLAMAFGVLGLRVPGMAIEDPGVVAKSWPEFWTSIDRLRAPAG